MLADSLPLIALAALTAAAILAAVVSGIAWLRARRTEGSLRAEKERLNTENAALRAEIARTKADSAGPDPENDGLRRELEAAREARETFFDVVTHELRSPLAAILGYQELLGDGAYGSLPPETAEPIDRIGRSARHLLHLIDGVVELSRIRSGTVRPDLGQVNLGVVLPAVADSFRTAARERRVEALVRLPASLPTIRTDQNRLLRALDLLVTSAVKHPGDDVVELAVTVDADGFTARISGVALSPTRTSGDDLALRVGIRLAGAHGVARILGGDLTFEQDQDEVIRTLSLRVADLRHDGR